MLRLLVGLALAAAAALGLRTFVMEPFRIPTDSMLPTLRPGDRLFVNKLLYGAQVPGTRWRLPSLRAPARGDVVVFRAQTEGGALLPTPWLVKRIVGLPGDRVRVRDGTLSINGAPVPRWPTGELWLDGRGMPLVGEREDLFGREHAVADDPGRVTAPFDGVVPAGHYFVLGDNRDHSSDSRRFGAVAFDAIVGPVAFLYWSSEGQRVSAGNHLAQLAAPRRMGARIE